MLRMTETSLGWRVSDDESRMSRMTSLRWRVSDDESRMSRMTSLRWRVSDDESRMTSPGCLWWWVSDDESRMASGRLFQVCGPAMANDLSPNEVCIHWYDARSNNVLACSWIPSWTEWFIWWNWCSVGELNEARQHIPVTGDDMKAVEVTTTCQRPDGECHIGNL